MARGLPIPPEPHDRATRGLLERVVSYADITPEATPRQRHDRLIGLYNLQVLAFQLWEHAMMVAQRDGVTLDQQADLMSLSRATVQVHIRNAKERLSERPEGQDWRTPPDRALSLPPRSRSGAAQRKRTSPTSARDDALAAAEENSWEVQLVQRSAHGRVSYSMTKPGSRRIAVTFSAAGSVHELVIDSERVTHDKRARLLAELRPDTETSAQNG